MNFKLPTFHTVQPSSLLIMLFIFILFSFSIRPSLAILYPNNGDLGFYVDEENPEGFVIARDSSLGDLYSDLLTSIHSSASSDSGQLQAPRIVNNRDPGASNLEFKLTSPSPSGHHPTSVKLSLVIAKQLDRETICPSSSYSTVSNQHDAQSEYAMFDGSLHGRDKSCAIKLKIASNFPGQSQKMYQAHLFLQDINDNPPLWSVTTLQVQFKDGDDAGSRKEIPLASDLDSGTNAIIEYHLDDSFVNISPELSYTTTPLGNYQHRPSELFNLVEEPGRSGSEEKTRLFLVARQPIDREANPDGWNLRLVATNTKSREQKSSLLLRIQITDINDNTPIFTQSIYQPHLSNHKVGFIPESWSVDQPVLKVKATDLDEGKNAKLRYSLVPGQTNKLINQFFTLTPDGELRVRRKLDVDSLKTNRNDLLHQASGSSQYFLPSGKEIKFDIQAVDGADAVYAKTGYATIQLTVEDVSDEPPLIKVHSVNAPTSEHNQGTDQAILVSVAENSPPGELVGLIEVIDPDQNGQESVACRLIGSNNELFRLELDESNRNEYRLTTSQSLDREGLSERLSLNVECRDPVDQIASSTILIHVIDRNDQSPKFEKTIYHYSLFEDSMDSMLPINSGSQLPGGRNWQTTNGKAYVKATDGDMGQNAQLIYSIDKETSDYVRSKFSIDPSTGQLLALGPFDRELESEYQFTVLGVDQADDASQRRTGSCTVNVHVLDVNDNSPVFSSPVGAYSFAIRENEPPGTRIGQVEAYDPDISGSDSIEFNDNQQSPTRPTTTAQLIYSLAGESDAAPFWIDSKSGVIITKSSLDRESQATYNFHVHVTDGPQKNQSPTGSQAYPPHTASVMVTVTIEDENDNEPVFISPNSTNHLVLLDPAAIPGNSILNLLAIDPDEGPNGRVQYSIYSGNDDLLFNVDQRQGLLYLESHIPLTMIEEANEAVASALGRSQTGQGLEDNESDDRAQGRRRVTLRPTYLLGLKACDEGYPTPRCSKFPNLQIQLRVPHNVVVDPSGAYVVVHPNQLDQDGKAIAVAFTGDSSTWPNQPLFANSNDNRTDASRITEIVVIVLSVVFCLVVGIILLAIFLLRRRSRHDRQLTRKRWYKWPIGKKATPPSKKHDQVATSVVDIGRSNSGRGSSTTRRTPPTNFNVELTSQQSKASPLGLGSSDQLLTTSAQSSLNFHPTNDRVLHDPHFGSPPPYASPHQSASRCMSPVSYLGSSTVGRHPLQPYQMFSPIMEEQPIYNMDKVGVADYQALDGIWQFHGAGIPNQYNRPDLITAYQSAADPYSRLLTTTSPHPQTWSPPHHQLIKSSQCDSVVVTPSNENGLHRSPANGVDRRRPMSPTSQPLVGDEEPKRAYSSGAFPKSSFV